MSSTSVIQYVSTPPYGKWIHAVCNATNCSISAPWMSAHIAVTIFVSHGHLMLHSCKQAHNSSMIWWGSFKKDRNRSWTHCLSLILHIGCHPFCHQSLQPLTISSPLSQPSMFNLCSGFYHFICFFPLIQPTESNYWDTKTWFLWIQVCMCVMDKKEFNPCSLPSCPLLHPVLSISRQLGNLIHIYLHASLEAQSFLVWICTFCQGKPGEV